MSGVKGPSAISTNGASNLLLAAEEPGKVKSAITNFISKHPIISSVIAAGITIPLVYKALKIFTTMPQRIDGVWVKPTRVTLRDIEHALRHGVKLQRYFYGFLSSEKVVQGIKLPAGTRYSTNGDGVLHVSHLPADTAIPYKGTIINVAAGSKLWIEKGQISMDSLRSVGLALEQSNPILARIVRVAAGKVTLQCFHWKPTLALTLASDAEIGGIKFPANWRLETYLNSKLSIATLPTDYEIQGIKFHAGDSVSFYENGKLEFARVRTPTKIKNLELRRNSNLEFDGNGDLVRNEVLRLTGDDFHDYVWGKRWGKNDKDFKDPPPSATGDPAGTPEGAPQGSEGSARIAAVPAINTPGADMAADGLGSALEKAYVRVRNFLRMKLAQGSTPEGHTFNVMVNSDADGTAENLSTRPALAGLARRVKEAGVSASSGIGGYVRTAGAGLITGAGILAIFDKLEASGKKVPKWAEPAAFIGTGTVQSIVMGGLNARSFIMFPAGLPAAITSGVGAHVMGKILGLDDKSNRWFSMIGGSLLMPAAMGAEVGGVSAMSSIEAAMASGSLVSAAPRILAASARGGLQGLAVAAAGIAGTLVGHYVVDQMPNVVAKKVLKKEGDYTYSGIYASAAYAINKKLGDPTGWVLRKLGII